MNQVLWWEARVKIVLAVSGLTVIVGSWVLLPMPLWLVPSSIGFGLILLAGGMLIEEWTA